MSFGAATTVIAGGEEPRVQAVWEDSAFGDISVGDARVPRVQRLPAFLEPAAVVMARVTSGDDLTAKSPLAAIPAYAGRSLAIVHGTDDTTILVSHAEALHAAAEANGVNVGDYWIVPAPATRVP